MTAHRPSLVSVIVASMLASSVLASSELASAAIARQTQDPAATTGAAAVQPAAAAVPDRAALEKQFEETLSGATLEGTFTLAGKEDKGLTREKYTLGKVKKIKDDLWLFEARIQYSDHDVTLPLSLQVKWAGDTPVITLTDVLVPGFGTFTARVLIYRGQYAGTWSGGDHGGHLFGKILKPAAKVGGKTEGGKKPTTGPK
jgi:hypothetical protein